MAGTGIRGIDLYTYDATSKTWRFIGTSQPFKAKGATDSVTGEACDNFMDAAPSSYDTWKKIVGESKTVIWNGPMGVFEMEKFAKGTNEMATILANATANGTYTLIGGGDSVAAINQMGFADKVSYVSTGGGAMLEALEGKDLPGIAAIRD